MKMRNRKNAQRGAILVEFAVALPFLLVLLMGVTEFGLLFYNKQVLTNASREGARAGIAYTSDSISDIVDNYCQSRLINFGSSPTVVTNVSGGGTYPADLNVSVSYNYTFLMAKLLGLGSTMTLQASTEMRMESFNPTGT